jgi:hypothetical protein
MAYIVKKSADRPWPVTVRLNVCGDDGVVTPVEQTFVGRFKLFDEDEHEAICGEVDAAFPEPEDGKPLAQGALLKRNAAYFSRLMVGWGSVQDEGGAPLPWSKETLAGMVTGPDGHAISEGLFVAVAEIRAGVAPLKNLLPSVAPGDSSSAAEGTKAPTAPT